MAWAVAISLQGGYPIDSSATQARAIFPVGESNPWAGPSSSRRNHRDGIHSGIPILRVSLVGLCALSRYSTSARWMTAVLCLCYYNAQSQYKLDAVYTGTVKVPPITLEKLLAPAGLLALPISSKSFTNISVLPLLTV